jgi:polyamine oxidase
MAIDPRGFKMVVQSEAKTFLRHEQLRLNATVSVISHSGNGVRVTLKDGQTLTADYVICTFRCVARI